MKLNESFLAQMREATNMLQSAGPMAATAAIQRALHDAAGTSDHEAPGKTPFRPHSASAAQPEILVDINPPFAPDPDAGHARAHDPLARFRNFTAGNWKGASARQDVQDVEIADDLVREETIATDIGEKGKFISASLTNSAGTRAYKLYVPSGYTGQPLPLVVMLHGCKQNPDDFAVGTTMNAVAEENNCFVAYPGQVHAANGSNCWNWFKPEDQRRDRGEPSIIADITRAIIRDYKIDSRRVYVAGLSAGGAMAAVMGASYPELYAAIGVHSGLPYGAAHDIPSAFAAMKKNAAMSGPLAAAGKAPASLNQSIPVIVFHGDRDTTVHPSNGDQALAQCVPASATATSGVTEDGSAQVEKNRVPNGRAYTRTVRRDSQGNIVAEQWLVHGQGHAWSGGSKKGSYTDPKGPSAAREMLRFFLSQTRDANKDA